MPRSVRGPNGPRPAPLWRRVLRILGRTARAYFADNIPRLGAALAFYITIAVAPLLVLTIAVAGMLFKDIDARETVVSEIEQLVGSQGAEVVDSIDPPEREKGGVLATIVGGVTLLFGALGVFRQLQGALNAIWRVHPKPTAGLWNLIGSQLFSMATVLMTGFLLLVSLIVSAALSWFGTQTLGRLDLPGFLLEGINLGLSFLIITFLFALIFKLLPNTAIRWRHVWLGAAVTALLFTIGKTALGIYLGRASVTSAYGAASSIIALLLWCYYASQIVFLGAEFTRITSRSAGGRDFTPLDTPEERSLA
jgi:membrane protein